MSRTMAALAVTIAACTPPTTLKNVQVAQESPRAKLRNVLVVALVKDPAARQRYETDMVKELRAAGAQAEASHRLLPIGETPTREALRRLVAERGFDGAVVGMLVDSRTEVRAVPPSGPEYYGFYGYAGWAGPVAYSPGYLETTKTIVVETRLFRTGGNGEAVFSATSETTDPQSVQDVTQPLAKLVVSVLRRDGFV